MTTGGMFPPTPVTLPSSYASLQTSHIALAHVPTSSTSPTPIIIVTLNRPEKNNAFTEIMAEELEKVFTLFDSDDRVKCIVLTGAGKMFCAGADLEIGFLGGTQKDGKTGRMKTETSTEHRDGGGRVALAIHQCSKPTIAAINGSAVGVGITMTLPACIRVTYEQAKIGFVFARRGLVLEACSSYFLPRLIGMSRALSLTTTGSVYPANHPLLHDLFSEILPTPEATLARALMLAEDIARNTSTVSTKLMRDLMYRGPNSAEATHLLDSRVIHSLFGSRDNEEGIKSFFEKRAPRFQATMQDDAPETYPWWSPIDIKKKPRAEGKGLKTKL